MRVRAVAVAIALCLSSTVLAADTPPMTPDISGKPFVAPMSVATTTSAW